MMSSTGSDGFLIVSVLVFVAVFLLLEGLYLVWKARRGAAARRMRERLDTLAPEPAAPAAAPLLKQRALSEVPAIERLLGEIGRATRVQQFIAQAGLGWTVARLVLSSAALAVTAFMAVSSLAHQPFVLSALASAIFGAAPWLYVQRTRRRRLRKIEQQLPEALDLITRALRAGHAFSVGLQLAGEELADPIAAEFRIVRDQVNFGVSLQQALGSLCERVPLTDLRYFVVAVLIQREAGGNLTEVLGNLGRLIRERLKLLARVKVLSSEGRLSAWVLGVMPFFVGGLMNIFNPTFMAPLWNDPLGITIVQCLVVMMVLGVLVLIRIVRIRV